MTQRTSPRKSIPPKIEQPLASIRRMMTWLSMCPADESTNGLQNMAYVVFSLTILSLNLNGFCVCLAYCLKFISTDFNGAVFAFMVAIGEFGLIYFIIVAILMRYQIGSIFASLATIYKTNKKEVEFRYLTQANNTSEWMWSIYFKYVAVILVGATATSLLSVLYCYLTRGNFNVAEFYQPAKIVYAIDHCLPWDQTTNIGYLAEICTVIPMAYGYFIINGTPLILFISLCLHHQTFSKMFKHSIDKSEQCDAKQVCHLIRFHISTKDLFLKSANVYSPFVLIQLICSSVMMTISVFYLDLQWHQFEFIMFSVMATISLGISVLFLYCYYGKLATDSYVIMSDCVFDMNWYEQPNDLQKYLIFMIANMQKPIYYHGFEVARLNLETFVQLLRKVVTYYVAIKTIAMK